MRGVFFGVYLAGALVSAGSMLLLEPPMAALVTMAAPVVLMWLAERMGYIHFVQFEPEEEDDSVMRRAFEEGLSDEQAIDKYGQMLVNEVNDKIAHAEAQVMAMKRGRNEMMRMIQERSK